ncbi:MAG: hypothetical protein AB1485_09560 [Candidatus Thermoplasmatota archaeon]
MSLEIKIQKRAQKLKKLLEAIIMECRVLSKNGIITSDKLKAIITVAAGKDKRTVNNHIELLRMFGYIKQLNKTAYRIQPLPISPQKQTLDFWSDTDFMQNIQITSPVISLPLSKNESSLTIQNIANPQHLNIATDQQNELSVKNSEQKYFPIVGGSYRKLLFGRIELKCKCGNIWRDNSPDSFKYKYECSACHQELIFKRG